MIWELCGASDAESTAFANLQACKKLDGEVVNSNPTSTLRKVRLEGRVYYLKIYHTRGRGLRRYVGRSRARAEWQNLQVFNRINVPTARLVGYGEEGDAGAVITEELGGAHDLASLAASSQCRLDGSWAKGVTDRLSCSVRNMHQYGFVHSDLKWRNILVRGPDVFIIDCPQGRRLVGPLLKRGVIKDLACLDKVAKRVLSRTQRLRFYLRYRELDRLRAGEKREIRRILRFFEGRE